MPNGLSTERNRERYSTGRRRRLMPPAWPPPARAASAAAAPTCRWLCTWAPAPAQCPAPAAAGRSREWEREEEVERSGKGQGGKVERPGRGSNRPAACKPAAGQGSRSVPATTLPPPTTTARLETSGCTSSAHPSRRRPTCWTWSMRPLMRPSSMREMSSCSTSPAGTLSCCAMKAMRTRV